MASWFLDIIHSAIVELIVTVIVVVVLAAWGRMKGRWSWPTMALHGLVAAACLLFLYEHLLPPPPKDEITEENIEGKVRQWLDNFGVTVTRIQHNPGIYFGFEASYKSDPKVIVGRPRDRDHYIAVTITVDAASPAVRERYQELPLAEKVAINRDLRMEVIKARIPVGKEGDDDLSARVTKLLPINDDLTESKLIEAVDEVRVGTILLNDIIDTTLEKHGIVALSPRP